MRAAASKGRILPGSNRPLVFARPVLIFLQGQYLFSARPVFIFLQGQYLFSARPVYILLQGQYFLRDLPKRQELFHINRVFLKEELK